MRVYVTLNGNYIDGTDCVRLMKYSLTQFSMCYWWEKP
jgi:hypothetical protein